MQQVVPNGSMPLFHKNEIVFPIQNAVIATPTEESYRPQ